MTTTCFDAGNDVRALLLVHDGFRAAVPQAARQVRALRPGDRRAARALARWWETCTRALRQHRRAADTALWPLVLAIAPELAGEVRRLYGELGPIEDDVALVTYGLARLGAVGGPEFGAARINLSATICRLDIRLRRHLVAAEQMVLPVLRHRVDPADWAEVRSVMLRPTGPRDIAALVPLFLAHTDDDHRQFLRAQVPAPVRVLHDLVLGPRYRHLLATLPVPAGSASPRSAPPRSASTRSGRAPGR
jgi:hypothetical protein